MNHKTTLLGPTVTAYLDSLPYWAHASIALVGTFAAVTAPIWLTMVTVYLSS
jgi:hypothetical protein|tara:strand:- start:391 stop:546 length:156 start_codon:yes stop_codon:yes gene_type:complete